MATIRRIRMRRTGGLVAGRPLETEVDLASGDPDATALAGMLGQIDVAGLAGRPAQPGPAADAFQYELTLEAGGEPTRITMGGDAVPPELRPVLEALEERALAELRERRGG